VLNKLRELRRSRSWSQHDLAVQLRVSRQTIHAIEAGKYDPSLPLAFSIARLFELAIEEIFQPDSPPVVSPPARRQDRDFID
jgi:putative transcriptional regulator